MSLGTPWMLLLIPLVALAGWLMVSLNFAAASCSGEALTQAMGSTGSTGSAFWGSAWTDGRRMIVAAPAIASSVLAF